MQNYTKKTVHMHINLTIFTFQKWIDSDVCYCKCWRWYFELDFHAIQTVLIDSSHRDASPNDVDSMVKLWAPNPKRTFLKFKRNGTKGVPRNSQRIQIKPIIKPLRHWWNMNKLCSLVEVQHQINLFILRIKLWRWNLNAFLCMNQSTTHQLNFDFWMLTTTRTRVEKIETYNILKYYIIFIYFCLYSKCKHFPCTCYFLLVYFYFHCIQFNKVCIHRFVYCDRNVCLHLCVCARTFSFTRSFACSHLNHVNNKSTILNTINCNR